MPRFLDYKKANVKFAKQMRKDPTPYEKKLWLHLRTLPVRVLRQRPIGPFIADFYCASKKLVIEVDGELHFTLEGIEKDKTRTEYLKSLGIKVIRFSNTEISQNFEGVCEEIGKRIKASSR